jgi:hypothetical protein
MAAALSRRPLVNLPSSLRPPGSDQLQSILGPVDGGSRIGPGGQGQWRAHSTRAALSGRAPIGLLEVELPTGSHGSAGPSSRKERRWTGEGPKDRSAARWPGVP